MAIQTISVEVPTGFKLKYSVYKVESLDVNYIENRGRNRRMDEDAPNLKKNRYGKSPIVIMLNHITGNTISLVKLRKSWLNWSE